MSRPVIPAEAVEAAAKIIYEADWHGPPFWESLDAAHPDRLGALTNARLALEAAAPHMLAGAWDEGKDAVWTFLGNQDPRRERPTNPYRPTP